MNASLVSRLSSIDWDFAGTYSESPFSAIHFHPSRFASQVPATLIGLLSKPGELILDPFVGSGTTLVEAQRLGRQSIGIELNPIAVLASRAKVINKPASYICRLIHELKQEAVQQLGRQMSSLRREVAPEIPPTVQSTKWYTPRVRHNLGLLWAAIQSFDEETIIIGKAAFSAILLSVCRETRHWGYVCDNTTPKANNDGDVLLEFKRVLDRLERAYQERDEELTARNGRPLTISKSTVIAGEAAQVLETLPAANADLVVTSPPYFGVCDYIKAQRLSLEWFGVELENLRLQEIGARSKRHRKEALSEYLEGLRLSLSATRRCMKRSARLALIIGESSKRDETLSWLRKVLAEVGFGIDIELNRTVSTQRRLAPSVTGEHLFIVSK